MSTIPWRLRWILLIITLATLFIGLRWGWVAPNEWRHQDCTLEQNAAWISVNWTSNPVDKVAVKDLAEQASKQKIRYLYPYTTYLKADGTFNPTYSQASDFVAQFRDYNEQTYLLAWVGIPLQNDTQIGIQGWVDLSQENERQKIVDFVVHLMQSVNFDGVHLNVETVPDNDPNYLLLLDEVRSALGPEYILSIASTYWLPQAINRLPGVDGYRWSSTYYQAIAKRVDQIATMTYDSLMPHPALYRLWLREQVQGISASLADSDVELLIGVSVSEEVTATHNPNAENLLNGVAGLCAGVAQNTEQPVVDGIAIYAAWEATQDDWEVWDAMIYKD